MRLLDLFAGAGGAGAGYARAGFTVVGCDIAPQPHNPHETYQDDVLYVLDLLLAGREWRGYSLDDFDAIHASPPCQEYSVTRHLRDANQQSRGYTSKLQPKLIPDVYARLRTLRIPWVLENVPRAPMPDAIELCGSMFHLPIRRHRWFASSHMLFAPRPCIHTPDYYNVIAKIVLGYGRYSAGATYTDAKGTVRQRPAHHRKPVGQAALGIDWMTLTEMSQAIPPAYTHHIGDQLASIIRERAA